MNINQTLNYIEATTSSLGKKEVGEIKFQTSLIRSKLSDTNLYLAVIGEFSSGKSTFINALLGFRLLKEAVTPTTACATYIQRKGKLLSIEVEFFTGSKFFCSEREGIDKLSSYLHLHFKQSFYDLKGIVEALTSDQAIAKSVKSLSINVPNANIPENIVIIDTPGFNPGSDDVSNHSEITKFVVENIADAAIILTPQEQAMSSTLIRFLKNNLQRYLHRCVFVVTKMDVIEQDAREDIIKYAKSHIQNDLGVSNPKLYGESAITMLPVKRIPLGKEHEWTAFKRDFSWFEHQIWSYLQSSKPIVIKEHVYFLTEDVINLSVKHLGDRQKQLESNKKFLEDHGIENIKSVCDKMLKAARTSVNTSINDIPISLSSAEYSSRSFAESTINTGVITLTHFKGEMLPKIKNKVESEARSSLYNINEKINNHVKRTFSQQVNVMCNVFSSHYDSFPSLRPKQNTPEANVLRFNSPNMAFSIAISKIDALEQEENTAAGVGAIAGGIIGFLFGGPVGAAVGAGIGGGGGLAAGDRSDEMRKAAIPLVKDEISSYFYSLKSKVENEICQIRNSYAKLLQDYADEHVKKYGEAIAALIIEHQEKINNLNLQIMTLKKAIFGLHNLKDEITHELAISKISFH